MTQLNGGLVIGGAVTDLSPLSCLTVLAGDLTVREAKALRALELPLQRISGALWVDNNAALATIDLRSLRSVMLVDLQALPALKRVDMGSVAKLSSPGLRVADSGSEQGGELVLDFHALVEVEGDVALYGLRGLSNLEGFSALKRTTRGGTLQIGGNPQLLNLDGLRQLEVVAGGVAIRDVLNSIELPALRSVGAVSVLGVESSIQMSLRPPMRSVRIPKVQMVTAHIWIKGIPTGEPVSEELVLDFQSLVAVGGDFQLSGLPNLRKLDGFSALQTIESGGVANTGVSACELADFHQRVHPQDGGALQHAGAAFDAGVCTP